MQVSIQQPIVYIPLAKLSIGNFLFFVFVFPLLRKSFSCVEFPTLQMKLLTQAKGKSNAVVIRKMALLHHLFLLSLRMTFEKIFLFYLYCYCYCIVLYLHLHLLFFFVNGAAIFVVVMGGGVGSFQIQLNENIQLEQYNRETEA